MLTIYSSYIYRRGKKQSAKTLFTKLKVPYGNMEVTVSQAPINNPCTSEELCPSIYGDYTCHVKYNMAKLLAATSAEVWIIYT